MTNKVKEQIKFWKREMNLWKTIAFIFILLSIVLMVLSLVQNNKFNADEFSNIYTNLTIDSGEDVNEFCRNEGYQGGWIETRPEFSIRCYNDYRDRTEYHNYKIEECKF